MSELIAVRILDREPCLREERQDRDASVTADDGHVDITRIEGLLLGHEGGGSNDVESRHPK